MLQRIKNAVWLRDYQQFLNNFQKPPKLELEYFHPVQLPVVITEAHVKMRTVQDYSVLSLLILRLFDAGIRAPEAIQSISGMSLETVKYYIQKEQLLLEHIDSRTNQLTELGRMTLQANENLDGEQVQSCQHYDSVLRVHIDPLTASLIPQYLEYELGDNINPNEDAGDFLLPRESAPTDETFLRELNTRLLSDINADMDEHIRCDVVKNGNILDSIRSFRPIRIFYRWGYLAKFKGMTYPMIAFSGRRSAENVNADSLLSGVQGAYVTMPIALAQTDKAYLEKKGIRFPKVLQRSDSCFDALREMVRNMAMTLPAEDAIDAAEPIEEMEEESMAEVDWEASVPDLNTPSSSEQAQVMHAAVSSILGLEEDLDEDDLDKDDWEEDDWEDDDWEDDDWEEDDLEEDV